MNISYDQIIHALRGLGLTVSMPSGPQESYCIASLFAPVDGGFYFYTSTDPFPFQVKNALILVSDLYTLPAFNNNIFLQVAGADVQETYYKILDLYFKRESNGQIATTSIIHPLAKLGKNVQIDDFCVVEACEIEDNVIVGSHTKIHANTIVGAGSIIESMCILGTQGVAWIWNADQTEKVVQPQLGGVLIGNNCFIGANTIIVRGSLNEKTMIGNNVLMAPGGRIGHGTVIEDFVHFANNVVTGGNTRIGRYSFVGSAAVFRPKVKIHPKTVVGAGSVVVKNTSGEGITLIGVPAVETPTVSSPNGMPKPKK